jgi:hypothetical protein
LRALNSGAKKLHPVFLAYIVLVARGIEVYRNAAEAAWILIWRRLTSRQHSASEILAYIKASVFGGDPALGFVFARGLTWQDRLLEICRYIGVCCVFIGLTLLALARDTSFGASETGVVCEFHFAYWIASCCLFGLSFVPVFAAAIVQLFTTVPPLTPHAAAVSLTNILDSMGESGSTVDDDSYIQRAEQCQCRWRVQYNVFGRRYQYPVLAPSGEGCNCPIVPFAPRQITSLHRRGSHHWLYLLIATGIAASLIGAYIVNKQQNGTVYLYDTAGQVWAIAVTFLTPLFTSRVIKDIARNRFMCLWSQGGVSAGYVAVSTRVWGSGAEWIWTALLFPEHRQFGWLAFWAYTSGFWVMLSAAWMAFDNSLSFGDSDKALHIVMGDLIFGLIVSGVAFYRLKKWHNHPESVFEPQPLKVIRWIRESIDCERKFVPKTKLGTTGYGQKRMQAGKNVNHLEVGYYI